MTGFCFLKTNFNLYKKTFFLFKNIAEPLANMKFSLRFYIVIALLIGTNLHLCNAQNISAIKYNFKNFTVADGLSQGMINCIFQDHFGFIWLATKDGLNRFDGRKFIVYKHNPTNPKTIIDNFIETIFEDSKGQLWIGTAGKGLDLLNRNTEEFIHYTYDEKNATSINDNYVTTIKEDKSKNLFVHTHKGWCKMVQKNGAIIFESLANFSSGNFFMMTNGDVFYLSAEHNILKKEKNNADFHSIATNNFLNKIIDIIEDTFTKRIFFISPTSIQFSTENNQLITTLINDKNAAFTSPYCFASSHKLWLLNHGKIEIIDCENGGRNCIQPDEKSIDINANAIHDILKDKSGNIWIGTKGYGVLKFNPNSKLFHQFENTSIGAMAETQNGAILICKNRSEQVEIFDKKKEVAIGAMPDKKGHYSDYENTTNFIAESIIEQWKNIFWICKDHILRYDAANKTAKIFRDKKGFCFPIFKDNHHQIWCGSENAFCKFDSLKNDFVEFPYPVKNNNSPYKFLECIYQDKENIFWLGTTNGLYKFTPENKEWKQFKNQSGDSTSLSLDLIFCICPDPQNPERYLWLGTNGGGINKFDKTTGKCTRYFSDNTELQNNVIYGILSDKQNNIWLSSNKGLSCFNTQTKRIKNFTANDGLQSNEFNRYSYYKTHDGYLFFGGVNGFNYFNPNEIKDNTWVPKILIIDFKINNRSVDFKDKKSALSKPIYLTDKITLNHKDNMISFDFTAMDFTAPEKNNYQYMLEGFDHSWIQADNNQNATYTNLDPGEYTFLVKGSNYDGSWNNHPTKIQLIILPPWYLTWWFRISIVIIIGLLIYSFYRFRINQTIALHSIRNRIASDLHDEIGSTLSSISLYGEVAQNMVNEKSPEASELLSQINKNTHDMMEAMSDIVWALNSKNDRFDNIINKMRAYCIERMEPIDCTVKINIDEQIHDLQLDMEQRKNLYLIFKEAINNVAKYAQAKNLFIAILVKNGLFYLEIKDDGVGFSAINNHSGNGLENMQKRAKSLLGNFKIVSEKKIGTTILLNFKI